MHLWAACCKDTGDENGLNYNWQSLAPEFTNQINNSNDQGEERVNGIKRGQEKYYGGIFFKWKNLEIGNKYSYFIPLYRSGLQKKKGPLEVAPGFS